MLAHNQSNPDRLVKIFFEIKIADWMFSIACDFAILLELGEFKKIKKSLVGNFQSDLGELINFLNIDHFTHGTRYSFRKNFKPKIRTCWRVDFRNCLRNLQVSISIVEGYIKYVYKYNKNSRNVVKKSTVWGKICWKSVSPPAHYGSPTGSPKSWVVQEHNMPLQSAVPVKEDHFDMKWK